MGDEPDADERDHAQVRAGAVRLAEAGVPSGIGSGLSKSAVSRRFKALPEARLAEWMASDLSQFDLLVIRIDGLHMTDKLLMIGAGMIEAGKGFRRLNTCSCPS